MGKLFSGFGRGFMESGMWLYKVLLVKGVCVIFDFKIGVIWFYDFLMKEFVSFDGLKFVNFKVEYIFKSGFGGVFFWEVLGDKKGD